MKLCCSPRASSCASTIEWRARRVNRSNMPSGCALPPHLVNTMLLIGAEGGAGAAWTWEDRLDAWEVELDLTAQLEGSDWVTLERAAADTGVSRAALRSLVSLRRSPLPAGRWPAWPATAGATRPGRRSRRSLATATPHCRTPAGRGSPARNPAASGRTTRAETDRARTGEPSERQILARVSGYGGDGEDQPEETEMSFTEWIDRPMTSG